MKGSDKVIEQLQSLLRGELAARDQYFTHSRMYDDWGLSKLYERLNHEMEEETEHANVLIRRMMFLETTPDLSQQSGLRIGTDIPSSGTRLLDHYTLASLSLAVSDRN